MPVVSDTAPIVFTFTPEIAGNARMFMLGMASAKLRFGSIPLRLQELNPEASAGMKLIGFGGL